MQIRMLRMRAAQRARKLFTRFRCRTHSKRWWYQPLIFVVAGAALTVFLSTPHTVLASLGSSDAQGWVTKFVVWILQMIADFLAKAILSVIDLLIIVSGYNNFIDAGVVNTGWVLVRDVANMFYIFILLVIAFGTMLKIEAYSWKKLLPRLLITAVLVNLSRTIIGFIIDFAQVIMITFVNGYAAAAGGNFAQGFNLDKMFTLAKDSSLTGNTDFHIAMAFILGTAMLAIALVVIVVFLAVLLGRIITLWVLIILSPLAFLLGTFPKGQEYYGRWWKQLQHAVMVGPLLAFFLWLSLATMAGGDSFSEIRTNNGIARDFNAGGATDLQLGPSSAGGLEAIGSFIVSIAMLMIGLQMTQEMGVVGSGLASGALQGIKSTATKIAKKVAVPAAVAAVTGGIGLPTAGGTLTAALGLGAGRKAVGSWKEKSGALGMLQHQWAKTSTEGTAKYVKGEYGLAKEKGVWGNVKALAGRAVWGTASFAGNVKRDIRREAELATPKKDMERSTKLYQAEVKMNAKKKKGEWTPDLVAIAQQGINKEYNEELGQVDSLEAYQDMTKELWTHIQEADAKGNKTAADKSRARLLQLVRRSDKDHWREDVVEQVGQMLGDADMEKGGDTMSQQIRFFKRTGLDKVKGFDREMKGAYREEYVTNQGMDLVDWAKLKQNVTGKDLDEEVKKVEDKQDYNFSNLDPAHQMKQNPHFFYDFENGVAVSPKRGGARLQTVRSYDERAINANTNERSAFARFLHVSQPIQPKGKESRKLNRESGDGFVRLTRDDLVQAVREGMFDKNQKFAAARELSLLGHDGEYKSGELKIRIMEPNISLAGLNAEVLKHNGVNTAEVTVDLATKKAKADSTLALDRQSKVQEVLDKLKNDVFHYQDTDIDISTYGIKTTDAGSLREFVANAPEITPADRAKIDSKLGFR